MFSCTAPRFPCRSAWMAPMFVCIASIEFLVSAWAAPMLACIIAMYSLLSACIAPIRSKNRSTAEPGRERRDEEVDLFDTLEARPDLVSILWFIITKEYQ